MFIGNNVSSLTPCIGKCELDKNGTCVGCYRTSEEITNWMHKTEDEKISIVIRCKKIIAAQSQVNAES